MGPGNFSLARSVWANQGTRLKSMGLMLVPVVFIMQSAFC